MSSIQFRKRLTTASKALGARKPGWRLTVIGLLALVVALVVSDFIPFLNTFWLEHSLIGNLVVEASLLLAALLGIEAYLDRRARKRWHDLAVYVLDIDLGEAPTFIVESVQSAVWSYQKRQGQEPDERAKDDTLLAALGDPETWEPMLIDEGDYRTLLEEVEKMHSEFEERVGKWASILVQSPQLSPMANLAPKLIFAGRRLVSHFKQASHEARVGRAREDWVLHYTGGSTDRGKNLIKDYRWYEDLAYEFIEAAIALRDEGRSN